MEAVPKGIFSNDFSLRLRGETVVDLDVSSWREKAEFELAGTQYRLYREGLMSGAFILEAEGQVLARAIKPSALRDRFDLSVGDGSFTLRKLSAWSRRFGVFDGELEVGRIRPAGIMTRRAWIELPMHWPVAVRVFVFWLALVIWNREAAAAAAS